MATSEPPMLLLLARVSLPSLPPAPALDGCCEAAPWPAHSAGGCRESVEEPLLREPVVVDSIATALRCPAVLVSWGSLALRWGAPAMTGEVKR